MSELDDKDTQLTQVGVRFGPGHMRMLMLLAGFFGGKTRAMTEAISQLYHSQLATNPAFVEWVADNSPRPDSDEGRGD